MKKLTDILKNTPVREVCGDTAAAIGGLVYDSRAVKPVSYTHLTLPTIA